MCINKCLSKAFKCFELCLFFYLKCYVFSKNFCKFIVVCTVDGGNSNNGGNSNSLRPFLISINYIHKYLSRLVI